MMLMTMFGLLSLMAFVHCLSRNALSSLHFSSFGPTNNDLQVLRKKLMKSVGARRGDKWYFQTSNGTPKTVVFTDELGGGNIDGFKKRKGRRGNILLYDFGDKGTRRGCWMQVGRSRSVVLTCDATK